MQSEQPTDRRDYLIAARDRLHERLLEAGLAAEDIAVIAPYAAQVRWLREHAPQAIQKYGFKAVIGRIAGTAGVKPANIDELITERTKVELAHDDFAEIASWGPRAQRPVLIVRGLDVGQGTAQAAGAEGGTGRDWLAQQLASVGASAAMRCRLTMATVMAPCSLAISAITGAAPVPVPPPMPAQTNTRCAPSSSFSSKPRSTSADFAPVSGCR